MAWFVALGLALIGQELVDPDGDPGTPGYEATPPSLARIGAALTAAGYPPEQLAELVAQRQDAGLPWPFPVTAEQRDGIGAAQFVSVLRTVADHLDVHSWRRAAPAPDRALTDTDRRLIADVPPHWS